MPTEPLAVIIYVFLLVPGLVYLLQSEKSRSAPRRSIFRETSIVVFASAVCLLVPLIIWALLAFPVPALGPPLEKMLVGLSGAFAADPILYFLIIVGYLGMATGLGVLFGRPKIHAMLSSLGADSSIKKNRSSWTHVFEEARVFEDMGTQVITLASIQLKSGTWLQGQVASYNAMVEDSDERALVLSGSLYVRTPTAKKPESMETGQQLVVQASEIEYMLVSYMAAQNDVSG